MSPDIIDPELKKGSADLLVLALLEERDRHGYEIGQLIATRSHGALTFHAASLYPVLYRLEKRGLIRGRWLEKAGERRKRFYHLQPSGRAVLAERRNSWEAFVVALRRVAGVATCF